jgi:hypothetical protein
MAAFRRVEDHRASATALGILVPPGPRTVVILRPRAMSWDLLALRPGFGPEVQAAFCDFDRDEAAVVARRVQQALARGAGTSDNPVETIAGPKQQGYRVCLRAGGLTWLACPRLPGQPYRPADFATLEEAREAALRLARIVCPDPDADQEFYFNTQNFSR